jgi:hypothetical protein
MSEKPLKIALLFSFWSLESQFIEIQGVVRFCTDPLPTIFLLCPNITGPPHGVIRFFHFSQKIDKKNPDTRSGLYLF